MADVDVAIVARKIGDLPWRKIVSRDGYIFYHNIETKESTWKLPVEVFKFIEQSIQDRENYGVTDQIISNRQQSNSNNNVQNNEKKEELEFEEDTGPNNNDKNEEMEFEEDVGPQQGGGAGDIDDDYSDPWAVPSQKQKPKQNVAIEEKITVFKQMLKDLHIGSFATWDVELPRLKADSRFSLIKDTDTKKAVFETFVKNKMEEDRKQSRDKLSKAREECKRLLTEMSHTTTLAEFGKILLTKSPAVSRSLQTRDLEKLYSEFVGGLKKQHEESSAADVDRAKRAFIQLLKETTEIRSNSSFESVKSILERDSRFNSKHLTPRMRQQLFDDLVKDLKSQSKIREIREKSRMLEKHLENDKQTNFETLLHEQIKDPEMLWSKAKQYIQNDQRFKDMDSKQAEMLFIKHLGKLLEGRVKDFKSLLAEQVSKGRLAVGSKSVDEIEEFVYSDQRWEVMRAQDREALFESFLNDLKEAEFANFKRCLTEFKNIGHLSSRSTTSGESYEHILELLSNDKRWKVLEPFRREREKTLKEFIEGLRNKK